MVTACKISRGHNREIDRHADGEIKGEKKRHRRTDGQTDGQTHRHIYIYTHVDEWIGGQAARVWVIPVMFVY